MVASRQSDTGHAEKRKPCEAQRPANAVRPLASSHSPEGGIGATPGAIEKGGSLSWLGTGLRPRRTRRPVGKRVRLPVVRTPSRATFPEPTDRPSSSFDQPD